MRLSVKEVILARLHTLQLVNKLPVAQDISSEAIEPGTKNMVLLFSIDSGYGTLRITMEFVTNELTQTRNEIILNSQAVRTSENHAALSVCFGPTAKEISSLQKNGTLSEQEAFSVKFFFTGSFEVIYEMTGVLVGFAKFSFPWCETPSSVWI